jgi:hypothetical protein
MAKETAIRVAATGVIVVSSAFLWFYWRGSQPSFNPKPHQAMGQVLAEEALKLADGGGRFIVFARDSKSFKVPAQEEQWTAFCQTVAQAGRKIASTNLLTVDPLRTPSLDAAAFAQRFQRAAETDVIVSFLGPPDLTDEQIKRLGPKRVSVVAVCTGSTPWRVNLKRLFTQRLLHTAIISRNIPQPRPADSAPLRNWFDGLFQIITAANAADLPTPANP